MNEETDGNSGQINKARFHRKEISLKIKIVLAFTFVTLYMIFLNVPLFGIPMEEGADPFSAFRIIFASQRGSLAEIGLFPIILASIFVQILIRTKVLKLDFSSKYDKKIYRVIVIFLSFVFSIFTALFYVLCGVFGEDLGVVAKTSIMFQLLLAQFIIILMVELIEWGYGLGSGLGLFIFVRFSFEIFNGMFSLSPNPSGGFNWFRGCVLAFFQGIFSDDPNASNMGHVLYSEGRSPDFLMLFMAIVGLVIVIGISAVRIELKKDNKKNESEVKNRYLFESSFLPVLQTGGLFSTIYFLSNLIWNNFKSADSGFKYFLVRLFGQWEDINPYGRQLLVPVNGLASVVTPPHTYFQIAAYPGNMMVFFILTVVFCGMFSSMRTKILEGNQRDNEQFSITIAWLGGFFIGITTGVISFLLPLGTSFGVVMSVFIAREWYMDYSYSKTYNRKIKTS